MSSYLLPKNYGSFYEINVTLGHEWYGKKFRHLYYGGELFAGKCKYIYPHGNQNFIENFTEGGLILFSGLKYDINRKLEFRTEFNIMGSVFKRTYGNSIKQNLDLRSLKPISIELYYKF